MYVCVCVGTNHVHIHIGIVINFSKRKSSSVQLNVFPVLFFPPTPLSAEQYSKHDLNVS